MNNQQGSYMTAPQFGEALVVSDGVLWTRFKIPSKLDHINIYLIMDVDGWFVIDTGPASDENRELWQNLLATLPDTSTVTGILVTHSHPDHIGLAGWLQDYCQAPLYISAKEIAQAELENQYRRAKDYSDLPAFYSQLAATAEDMQSLESVWDYVDEMFGPLPTDVTIVQSGDTLEIGGEDWQLWSSSGHSIEHLCLQKASGEVLIAGDQIIAHITPYVGINYLSQEADPLASWLTGLTDMLAWINPKAQVLPAHNKPFYHGEIRVREVLQHHQNSLDKLRGSLEQWRTVNELASVLGWAKKQGFARCLALEETFAHITYLVNTGEVICKKEQSSGVLHYQLA